MRREEWLELFTRVHEGDAEGEAHHGPATRTILRDVAADAAARRPLPAAHTIFEIVQHILAWRELVRSRLAGGPARPMADAEDWAPVSDAGPAAWQGLLARLERNQRALLALLRTVPEVDLARSEGLLTFLIHHELHHAGQIALLKRGVR